MYFSWWNKNPTVPASRQIRRGTTRRQVRSVPPVAQLEDRILLSGSGATHAAELGSIPVVAAQVHLMGGNGAQHHNLRQHRNLRHRHNPHSGGMVAHALNAKVSQVHANRAYLSAFALPRSFGGVNGIINRGQTILPTNPGQFLTSSNGVFSTDNGSALPGTNPGGGTRLSGALNGPGMGTMIPGTNPGGGTSLSGSLGGPDMGAMVPGTNPGGGLTPSGTLS